MDVLPVTIVLTLGSVSVTKILAPVSDFLTMLPLTASVLKAESAAAENVSVFAE